MKKRSLKTFKFRKYLPFNDDEGNVIESYSDDELIDKALLWPASSKLQFELYGMHINSILNMHYYGSLAIEEHDMIICEGISYKVVSIKKYKRFRALEIERL